MTCSCDLWNVTCKNYLPDVKVYSDLPKEISERRKRQWPKLKKAREEGKTAFFNKPEPDKLFVDGQFVPL